MNLYGYLVWECIFYGFDEGIDFINIYFYMVLYYVLWVFNCIVIECGMYFKGFEWFKYVFGEFFDKYIDWIWELKIQKVCQLFVDVGICILMQDDWCWFKELV